MSTRIAEADLHAALAKRDLVVDLARVACVVLVVVIHLLMIGVGVGADGQIVASRPLEKEIWLTEAYACTRLNGWWNDTYRHAAENVFLTLAIAKADGIRCVNWYQFHDSVLGNAQGCQPRERRVPLRPHEPGCQRQAVAAGLRHGGEDVRRGEIPRLARLR